MGSPAYEAASIGMERTWQFVRPLRSALWNTTFVLAGYLLGEEWHLVEPVVGWLQWVVLALVVALTTRWVVLRVRHRRQRRRGERC